MEYLFKYNLILLGDQGVGKSSILNNFLNSHNINQVETTIGVDFGSKILQIDKNKIKLHIWDTAGHERFRSITTSYLNKAECILLIFDLSNSKSFKNISYWIEAVKKVNQNDIPMFLIGNKNDLISKFRYEEEINLKDNIFDDKNLIEYYEVNINNIDKINKIFLDITRYMYEKRYLLETKNKNNINNKNQNNKNQNNKNSNKIVNLDDKEENNNYFKKCC